MTISRKFLQFGLLVLLFVVMGVAPAEAADVFATVKGRAVSFLVQLKPVIFILGGFGLIGFAWMAVFGQISWKWFANIAMGLFLVANMGIFIDYFAKKDNSSRKYGDLLGRADYADHLGPNYQGTNGTAGDPNAQTAANNEGTGGASSSDQLDSELDKRIASASNEGDCTSAGGDWDGSSCSKKNLSGMSDEERFADNADFERELAQIKDPDSCSKEGGVWWDNKCVPSWAAGNDGFSFVEREKCLERGGNWDGKKCNDSNPAGGTPNSGDGSGIDPDYAKKIDCVDKQHGTWNDSLKMCVINATEEDCKSQGLVSDGKGGCTVGSSCPEGQRYANGGNVCLSNTEADCYDSGKYSYSKEWGCLSQFEFENKTENAKRKCQQQSGYEWVEDKYNPTLPGSCQKSQKQGNKDCKAEKGSDYEWDSIKQECVLTEKAAKKACEAKAPDYEWNKNKKTCEKTQKAMNNDCKAQGLYVFDLSQNKCISEEEHCMKTPGNIFRDGQCASASYFDELDCKAKGSDYKYVNKKCVNGREECEKKGDAYIWLNGQCESKAVVAESLARAECDAKGDNYVYTNGKCMTKEEECATKPSYVWNNGSCRHKTIVQKEECAAKGKDYEWNSNKQECVMTEKAAKRDCEQRSKSGEKVFWSDRHKRCIDEE